MNKLYVVLMFFCLWPLTACDADDKANEKAAVVEVDKNSVEKATVVDAGNNSDEKSTVRDAMLKVFPNQQIDMVEKTPVQGIYEVVLGTKVFYVTGDGKYVFSGDLIQLANRRSLTDDRKAGIRREILKLQSEDSMIVFRAKDEKFKVTIFTDIDCGYCRKLHQQMAGYNDKGITVRYMAYPRAGIPSRSYQKAVNVWCAKDRKKAMTDAKAGLNVNSSDCNNPVKSHFELGDKLGVRGTPAIFMESGDLLPGYMPPERLFRILAQN